MAKLWSQSALATELQINPRTVAKALAGTSPDGQLAKRPAWHLRTALTALGVDKLPADRADKSPEANAFTSARARWMDARARTAQLEREMLEGKVGLLEEFETGHLGIASVIRQRALALPRRAAPIVATMSRAADVEQYLTGVIYEMLEALSQVSFVGTRRPPGATDSAEHVDVE